MELPLPLRLQGPSRRWISRTSLRFLFFFSGDLVKAPNVMEGVTCVLGPYFLIFSVLGVLLLLLLP